MAGTREGGGGGGGGGVGDEMRAQQRHARRWDAMSTAAMVGGTKHACSRDVAANSRGSCRGASQRAEGSLMSTAGKPPISLSLASHLYPQNNIMYLNHARIATKFLSLS